MTGVIGNVYVLLFFERRTFGLGYLDGVLLFGVLYFQ